MFDTQAVTKEFFSEHINDAARAFVFVGSGLEQAYRLAVVAEPEFSLRLRERDRLHEFVDVSKLGSLGAQEFAPCRQVVEQIADFNIGADRMLCRVLRARLAAVDFDAPGRFASDTTRRQCEARHRSNRRQSFAAEAQRADALEVVERGDLARCVCGNRERQIVRINPIAVVANSDQACTTLLDVDLDARGAGVEAVLDQFLDHRRRPFDDLAGGNLVDQFDREGTDARHDGTENRARIRAERRKPLRQGRFLNPTESAALRPREPVRRQVR